MCEKFLARDFITKFVPLKRRVDLRRIQGTSFIKKALAFDCPVKDFQVYATNVVAYLHVCNYLQPIAYMGNEGGSIMAVLLAAGFKPSEILDLIESGKLDPLGLIEGDNPIKMKIKVKKNKKTRKIKKKVKIGGKKSSKVHGAQHKGRRFSDTIDELVGSKLNTSNCTLEALHSRSRIPVYIPVLNEDGDVIILSYKNYPNMKVADAVRASCAVQPLISRVAYKDENKGIYKFASATPKFTLDYDIYIKQLRKDTKLDDNQSREAIVGFGWEDSANAPEYISKKSDYYHRLNQNRARHVLNGLQTRTHIFNNL